MRNRCVVLMVCLHRREAKLVSNEAMGSQVVRTPVAPTWSGQLLDPYRFEVRFGGFAHGVGSVESGTVGLNGEFVFPRFPFGRGEWRDFLVPRPHIGVMASGSDRTSCGYAGAVWTIPLPWRFFTEIFFGGALADGMMTGDRTHLGARL
jgi:hypothetical protein